MRQPSPNIPPFLDQLAALSWRILVVAALVGVVIFILSRLPFVVLALFLSFLAVSVLSPVRSFIERRGVGHLLAVWLVIVSSAFVAVGILAAVVVPFILEADELVRSLREGVDELTNWLSDGPLALPEERVEQYRLQIETWFQDNTQRIASGVIGTTVTGFQVVTSVVFAVPIIFFLLKDSDRINQWTLSWIAADQRERARQVGAVAWKRLSTFIQGTAFVASVDAVFIGLGLFIVGIPLAGSLAVLTFVSAFIPIVGALAAGVAAVLVAFVAQGPVAALIILGVVVAVQQIEGNVLSPLVVGRAVQLHPLAILLAITVGGTLAGIMGAFVAVPLTAVLYAVASELRYPKPIVAASRHPEAPEREET